LIHPSKHLISYGENGKSKIAIRNEFLKKDNLIRKNVAPKLTQTSKAQLLKDPCFHIIAKRNPYIFISDALTRAAGR